MKYLIMLVFGFWLGYKAKTLIEFLNVLKIKNYCKYYVEKMEERDFEIIKMPRKNKKINESEELENDY